jgi:hypothetical protein
VYLPQTKSLWQRARALVRVCVCVFVICEHSLEIKCSETTRPRVPTNHTTIGVCAVRAPFVYVTAQTHSHKSSLLHLPTHTNCARSLEFATRESLDKRIERENTSLVCACVLACAHESDVSKMYQSRACGETKSCVGNSLPPLTSERISRVWKTRIATAGRQRTESSDALSQCQEMVNNNRVLE